MRKSCCGCTAEPYRENGVTITAEYNDERSTLNGCVRCGYLFFTPPSAEVLTKYYAEVYHPQQCGWYNIDNAYHSSSYAEIIETVTKLARARFSKPFDELITHDVGCSFGGLVHKLRQRGFLASGTDLNAKAVDQGREHGNVHIHSTDCITYFSTKERKADIITLIHSLEHMSNPLAGLSEIKQCLADDGFLFIQVPNGLYWPARHLSMHEFYWFGYPVHLHYFTPQSLSCLLEKAGLHLHSFRCTSREENDGLLLRSLLGTETKPPDYRALLEAMARNGLTCELEITAGITPPEKPEKIQASLDRLNAFAASLNDA